ncbi:nitrate reductase (quinol-dependent), catalytic subunit [Verrucomicrobium sp. GAS474]|uniref:molybdopterin oxidoreductase family protein n=1 Tax=Verrucomicrobium sp. GAS474 TaxID=1882831 RepID=UPI00087CC943|nr:molybdopterin oxidoreductase family protein [Verrucomicrobium sp. GAS474]SDT95450.1 nitrate reductase (quinol-dependent), catalytic subunit [Verrucomicrobium sp. GAS474]
MTSPLPPLRAWDGPLTRDLVLRPGDFGLGHVPERLRPDALVTSVCGFCSTGCGLNIHMKGGRAVNLTPAADYPVNLGMACPKGWEALAPLAAPDRGTTPLVQTGSAPGRFAPVGWEAAARLFADRFQAVADRHGPDSLAWLGTGQIFTEELALLGAVAKFGMGFRHGDGNTRQCMATAVAAYKESFGFDAPPFTYADFEETDVLFLVGSNLCIAHPILWQRIVRNRRGVQVIVVDPRRTETATAAAALSPDPALSHLAIRPKSDLLLFHGLARLVVEGGGVDAPFVAAHTEGFDDFAAFLADPAYAAEAVAAGTGLPVETLRTLAALIGKGSGKRVSFWWTMGVNQGHEATRTAQALINLALLTGNIGKPGTGANSITGQCNAMGSRLFSNTTGLLGGRDFRNAAHRAEVARITGIPEERIPSENSLAYDQIVEGIEAGTIKGLWIVATNTAHSWIGSKTIAKTLAKLDFLVVQDLYPTTETARLAHLYLPAAGWGEKEGTFINSERRIGHSKAVSPAPGAALSDFRIVRLLAEAWGRGCGELFRAWTTPEAVFRLLQRLSAGRPCDFSGIGEGKGDPYRHLDEAGGIQWPWAASQKGEEEGEPARERRLFERGENRFPRPNGKALFVYAAPRPMPERPDAEYPFLLLTGRGSSAQWHTGSRTEKSAVLRKLRPGAIYAEVHPDDARRLGLGPRDSVRIVSRRGSVVAAAYVTASVPPGHVFLPMHYAETNLLTFPAFDPHSRQPSYKAAAVRLEVL